MKRSPTWRPLPAAGGNELGLALEFRQTNGEYQIIDWIHEARERGHGIVIDPAACAHTSVAVLDALNACSAR